MIPAHPTPSRETLRIRGLSLRFQSDGARLQALDSVDLDLIRGETLALVGESGCGKSATALAIMGLLPHRGIDSLSGSIRLDDIELLGASEAAMRRIRGRRIGMVFQDPMTSLDPVHTVGMQIAEVVRRHKGAGWTEARAHARRMLDLVRIPAAADRLDSYPHEFSGGMRQRVMIAMALACDPDVLIADEPTTALDVTIQAQVLGLIDDIRRERRMSVLLITHDLGVVAAVADRVAVMYAGRIVEEGSVRAVFSRPSHGYTVGLLRSLPDSGHRRGEMLADIPGAVPRLDRPDPACTFAPRCAFGVDACRRPLPPPARIGETHIVRCVRADAVADAASTDEIVRAWA